MNTTQPDINIRDLGLAAALISCGFEMTRTERDANGRAYFIFDQTEEVNNTIRDFWANKLCVKARQYSDDTKMLKGRIYADK